MGLGESKCSTEVGASINTGYVEDLRRELLNPRSDERPSEYVNKLAIEGERTDLHLQLVW